VRLLEMLEEKKTCGISNNVSHQLLCLDHLKDAQLRLYNVTKKYMTMINRVTNLTQPRGDLFVHGETSWWRWCQGDRKRGSGAPCLSDKLFIRLARWPLWRAQDLDR
jgi:hypothetical protein